MIFEKIIEIAKYYDWESIFRGSLKLNKVDIVLSDIEMPNLNGLDLVDKLDKISPDTRVILITAHQDWAYQAYVHHPYSFVHKPDTGTLLEVELSSLLHKLDFKYNSKNIVIQLGNNEAFTININTTVYITVRRNYIIVHSSDGTTDSFRGTIKKTIEILKPYGFLLVKSGCIVNCRFIKKLGLRTITLLDGKELTPTSDTKRRDELYSEYFKFIRENGILC